jgi:uncharacterized protein YbbC (DUF1343 family)
MSHGRQLRLWSVVLAVSCATSPPSQEVRPGIEVLLSDSLHVLSGKRIGVLTNQSGVDRHGTNDIDLLQNAGVHLTALFSPEHGFRGLLDQENIGNDVDPATGVPIFSLYGDTREPTVEMLDLVDLLIIDLQDIGARPYTYISTALWAMRSARDAGVEVVVLDRPNPIGGGLVQGPVRAPASASFNGLLQIPMRHGLTFGELALYGNAEMEIGASLTVIPMDGWRREQWYDETGLPWIPPSPNMPDLESATHYAGMVIFEATNLSVGRGTPMAFQVLGAPWLRPAAVVGALGEVPGVSLSDTVVTPEAPTDSKYDGVRLPALRLRVTDRGLYDPVRLATRILAAVHSLHGDSLTIRPGRFDRLIGTPTVREALEGAGDWPALWGVWERAGEAFEARRVPFLLYR